MTAPLDTIWHGDQMQRRGEAAILERFLTSETRALAKLGREQAFVLALDAQYGEGKSWFLARLKRQLELNHPVAFIDAWIDDANHEPLVTIMAAIEVAMQPFLKTKGIQNTLGALTRAALPIIGKAIIGAGGKLGARYLGEQFGDSAKAALEAAAGASPTAVAAAQAPTPKKDKDDPLEAAVDGAAAGLGSVVDQLGAAMLKQYRARQASRERFKTSLRALAASIDAAGDPRHSPIYIIVDELDRCRPSYAIALLEEIKHLFDVPGIVFVIALHGQQLTHSINAVYGEKFDSQAYLRRFFTRTYGLRRLSIRELVVSHFDSVELGDVIFGAPDIWDHGTYAQMPPAELAGGLLSEWQATPREALAVIDALRLFVANWDLSVPIELPLALLLLLNLVRNDELTPNLPRGAGKPEQYFAFAPRHNDGSGRPDKNSSREIFDAYLNAMHMTLHHHGTHPEQNGPPGYMQNVLRTEFARVHGNVTQNPNEGPVPSWASYPERVRALGRFVDPVIPDAPPTAFAS